MSDGREVVQELVAGGREAWDRFAREYRLVVLKAVHAAGQRFRASEADVEDATSQVFVELLEEGGKVLRSYQGRSAFTTWLSVIAYRVAAREFGRRRRARETEAARPARPAPPPDAEVLRQMEKLPETDRRALVFFHINECSYREISERMGIPLNQVGMVLLRAREKLARILGKSPP